MRRLSSTVNLGKICRPWHQDQPALRPLEGQEPRDVLVEVADVAARGFLEPRDDPEGRGLAGRVRADHADDLPGTHGQAHVVEDVHLGIAAIDALKREHARLPYTPPPRQARSGPAPAAPPQSSGRS